MAARAQDNLFFYVISADKHLDQDFPLLLTRVDAKYLVCA